jgi:hypothetical protein
VIQIDRELLAYTHEAAFAQRLGLSDPGLDILLEGGYSNLEEILEMHYSIRPNLEVVRRRLIRYGYPEPEIQRFVRSLESRYYPQAYE